MNIVAYRAGLPPTGENVLFTVYCYEPIALPRVGDFLEHGYGDERKMYQVKRVDHVLMFPVAIRLYCEVEK